MKAVLRIVIETEDGDNYSDAHLIESVGNSLYPPDIVGRSSSKVKVVRSKVTLVEVTGRNQNACAD